MKKNFNPEIGLTGKKKKNNINLRWKWKSFIFK